MEEEKGREKKLTKLYNKSGKLKKTRCFFFVALGARIGARRDPMLGLYRMLKRENEFFIKE